MKTIIFFILLVVLLFTAEAILSLENTLDTEQDNDDNLIPEFIVLLLCLGGVMTTGRSIFRKYLR